MTFGELLREARIRAQFESYTQLAKHLREQELSYSDEAVGHWERGDRAPQDRQVVLKLCQILVDRGGILTLSGVEAFLTALGWDTLSLDEQLILFPTLRDDTLIPNMPPKPHYVRLVGRNDTIRQVINDWKSTHSPRIVCLSGLGGIGKTAVCYEIMRYAMQLHLFDGLLWESVKSEQFIGTERAPQEALTDWHSVLISYALQLNQKELISQPVSQIKRGLRQILETGRYLIVLDNLESFEALKTVARELRDLIGEGKSRILITSRERLVDMPATSDIQIAGLSYDDTCSLLFDEAKMRQANALLNADKSLLTRVHQVTGGMPLAIQLIVTQFLLGIPLDHELNRLIEVTDEQELYRFIYFAIWRKLPPVAQHLLIATGAIPSAMTRSLLMEAGELSDSEFDQAVSELVRSSLLNVHYHPQADYQRYEIHAMTYWFVNVPLYEAWQDSL